MGDFGTLFPLAIGYIVVCGLDPAGFLVMEDLTVKEVRAYLENRRSILLPIGITEQQLIDNLMFTGERPHDTMRIGINPDDAKRWFGVVPPV